MHKPAFTFESRIFSDGSRHFIGLQGQFAHETIPDIPLLWDRFNATDFDMPGVNKDAAFGIVWGGDDGGLFEYMCAWQIAAPVAQSDYASRTVAAGEYLVIDTKAQLSTMRDAMQAGFSEMNRQGLTRRVAPMLEYYGPNFDPETGQGGYEIWFPITL